VGGIKEKALAAHRAGIKRVLLPERNRKDLVDIPQEVQEEMQLVFVSSIQQVINLALMPVPKSLRRKRPPEATLPDAAAAAPQPSCHPCS
jgi:ATP-dependent Lon protease